MSEPIKRRFHRERAVRRHASGKWICTIGRVWSAKKNKLVDKDWYFEGNEVQATADANAKARQWEILCLHWAKRDQPALEILGDPQPDQPRWPTNGISPQSKLTEEQVQRIRREGVVDTAELAEAYAEFSYPELISAYEWDRRKDVSQGEVELSTLAKELSQMRQVALVLPSEIPAIQLRAEHFRSGKTKLLDQFERRTARNYLSAGVKLLRWLYGRYGGDETRIPAGIEEAITIRKATKTAIKVYGVEQLNPHIASIRVD